MGKMPIEAKSFKPLMVLFSLFSLIWIAAGCQTTSNQSLSPSDETQEIARYQGEMSKAYDFVPTTDRMLSLTVHGIGDQDTIKRILEELDHSNTKATFFLPGMRIAEEPDIAREIAARGHEIGNQTLNGYDLNSLDYKQIYQEIHLANEILMKATDIRPRFVSTRSGAYSDDVRLVTAQLGMDAVVSSSLRLGAQQDASAGDIKDLVRKRITRGGIIAILADHHPKPEEMVRIVVEEAAEINYQIVPLGQLIEREEALRPLSDIPGYDAAKIQPDYEDAAFKVIRKVITNDKVVSLTFDDWGSDYTVTKTLDILDQYEIPASFFLRVNGVEHNPNLARAILKAGHEVANHTYSHPDITTLSPSQLQEEVVRAHQIMTEALQEQPLMMFCPPMRSYDKKAAEIVAATGYSLIVNYDVTTFDWNTSRSAADLVETVKEKTGPGSIILLHILDDLPTLEALPEIIEYLLDQGYTFVKVTDLIEKYPLELEMHS